ncbi:hypothetical protein AMC90_PD00960 (plasmid) [Rhizobium phaseoli]|nr:hypothetical protein AMC90_PD00960 [Rhizobium phaseoli]
MGIVRAAQVAGLLYVWCNVVQVVTSYPIGVLADRYGQRNIPVIGYALGAFTAILTALAFAVSVDNVGPLADVFFVAGFYGAVQEAIESTVTAEMVNQETLSHQKAKPSIAFACLRDVSGDARCTNEFAGPAFDW